MVPFHMWRPATTGQTGRVFPILTALRADATRIKRIPDMPASGQAHPAVEWTWNPFAFWTVYLDFPHTH